MNKLRLPTRLNAQIRSEATEWLMKFSEEEADTTAREDFNHWLRTSPEHVRAYLRIAAFWQEADHIDGKQKQRDIDALVQLARREQNVFPLDVVVHEREGPGPHPRRWRLAATAAALLLTLGIATATWFFAYRAPVYTTDTGEQRTVGLPDGSSVVINARSSIAVLYTDTARVIELREGQALFKVAKNAGRPFVVRSAGTSVRAVGTQFDVNRKASGTVVTVVEGRVAVNSDPAPRWRSAESTRPQRSRSSSGDDAVPGVKQEPAGRFTPARDELLLRAGEQAVVTSSVTEKSIATDLEAATAWTQGLLVFEGAPLSEVAQEFNRQNAKPLVLAGAALADLRVSGTFPARGADRIVDFLKERFHVIVNETDDEIRISSGESTGTAQAR